MQMKNTPLYRTTPFGGLAEPCYGKTPTKVVSIPVHFVGSERTRTNSDSATKIQKVLRGFLVRNTLRKIASMRVELERIESEIRVEVMKLKREQMERVRVSETIMNLLLKLDSVRVLHYSGLREYRKSLVNKAISLQEMLDQMAVPNSDECVGEENYLVKEEEGKEMETLRRNGEVEKEKDRSTEEVNIGLVGTSFVVEKEGEIKRKEQEEGEEIEALNNEDVEEEDSEGGRGFVGENCSVKEEEGDFEREKGDGKKDLLEKMVEDNQKMMEMMAQLFQRNEMQTTVLTSLTQRVDQLERALACEMLRRKKKRKGDSNKKQIHPKNGFS